jgi:threonine dehydratase
VPVAELMAVGLRCPGAGDDRDVDHVLEPVRPPAKEPCQGGQSPGSVGAPTSDEDADPSPFVRYRQLLAAWHLTQQLGWSNDRYADLVHSLERQIAAIDGHSFLRTPFGRADAISDRLAFSTRGGVWIKDETGNVAGSHKGRHLTAVMLYLLVAREVGAHAGDPRPPLAIASCGNAALAAAVVSRAAGFDLSAFVPPDAATDVLQRLRALGTTIVFCQRRPGEIGDPCYLRFREALADGALAFCCQGPDNALTVEGGETLGREMVDALDARGLDRLCLQVGGGAFASSFVRAFRDARRSGRVGRLPRIHAVQTLRAFPLARAWARVVLRALERHGDAPRDEPARAALAALASARPDDAATMANVAGTPPSTFRGIVDELAHALGGASNAGGPSGLDSLMQDAARRRASIMTPWEVEPHSVAHGILDDETYDWRAVVAGMIESGGWPVLVTEEQVVEATTLGHQLAGIDVDPTGAAGFAGVLALGAVISPDERVGVVFSGARRERDTAPRAG